MPIMNAQFFLNTYSDANSSNAPSLNNVRWCRNVDGFAVQNPLSRQLTVLASQTLSLFDQARTLTQDNTTQYSLSVSPFDSSYSLTWVGGTAPNFRTARALSTNASSTVTVSVNGPLLILTAGTNLDFSHVVPGDYVTLGSVFSPLNMGTFKVLSASASDITVENDSGTAEGPITLGAGYASVLTVCSAAGVQIGDSLVISAGFSPLSQQTFTVIAASPTALQFSSTAVLPIESNVTTEVAVYSAAKRLFYLETDQKLNLTINGTQTIQIQPLISNDNVLPGIYLSSTLAYSISIANPGITDANLFIISAE